MFILWFLLPFLVLLVLFWGWHEREEEDSGHSDPSDEDEEGEGDEGEDDNESSKTSLTPLWNYVTKLEGGKGGGTTKFLCRHDCHQGKPYTSSHTRVRRHLCGVMESDDNKGSLGVSVCPRVSQEERQKYITIEQAPQRMCGKKQKVQSHGSSKFGGYTSTSPHASATSGSPSRRTIANFLDIGGRDEVDANMVRFLYACDVPFNVLHSPYWYDMVKAINKAPLEYNGPGYEKVRTVLLDKERAKVKRAIT